MDLETKIYNTETDEWKTVKEIASVIIEENRSSLEYALNCIDYSLKHGILVSYDTYKKRFAPYENK